MAGMRPLYRVPLVSQPPIPFRFLGGVAFALWAEGGACTPQSLPFWLRHRAGLIFIEREPPPEVAFNGLRALQGRRQRPSATHPKSILDPRRSANALRLESLWA